MSFIASFCKTESGSEGSVVEKELVISTEQRPEQHLTDPPNISTDAISYSSCTEHPEHLYHEPPMTEKKMLKQSRGHKQQNLKFSDDTNIGERPEVPQLPIRPVTSDDEASYQEAFYAAITKNQSTAAEQEPKRLAKAKTVKSMARTAKANENKKENEPIRAQSQSPVQMPCFPSSASFIAKGSSEFRIPQFGDFNNIRGVIRETLYSNEDHEVEGMQDEPAHQQQTIFYESDDPSQRQYSGGNQPIQGIKIAPGFGDMPPPPASQHAARRNAGASKKESKSRVASWFNTDPDEASQRVGDVGQEIRDSQYISRLGQGSINCHGKRPLDRSDDDETIQEPIPGQTKQVPQAESGYYFMPHLVPGARGATRRFPQPQPVADPDEYYKQLFNPEEPLSEPQDAAMRVLAASLVDNTKKTPPFEYRRKIELTMVRDFKEKFLDAGLPDGMLSPEVHAELISRNAKSRMYANRLDNLLKLCDSIECLLYCKLPHNKRRYPAPPFCPSRANPPTFPPSPDEAILFVADDLYDESIQLLTDAVYFMLGFERHGISQNPVLLNDDVSKWYRNFGKLENSLNRMGVLVDVIGNRCQCGQWDYVAGMGEVLNAVGGIWTIVTGTLRPPNWEGRIPHLSVGIDPANAPPNNMILGLQSPQVTEYPQQQATPGNALYNYQHPANAAGQYLTIPSLTSSGYGQYPSSTYRTATNPGSSQYPGTSYQTAGHELVEYGQQTSSTYQTASHSGYSQYPNKTYRTADNVGTSHYPSTTYQPFGYSQQPSSTYQTGGNSGYGPCPDQRNANRQWVPDLAYSQPSSSASTPFYPQQISSPGPETGTADTGGPIWYEALPDGIQPSLFED
ncbi:hypothetical protein L211DRAFT_844290 [Terfezia boudieri ATCC MYA-4762]|uniref:Uncharacterized protein n=1 Tax=Terfezia boudieri ATCC MYA-4762 TaxID=1051890 RepID=A0A3N4M6E1_9PEZI|nr:hypothetical protein L211DRAFT_844290 [Terfezia boudieri ATCC MYA-4762]